MHAIRQFLKLCLRRWPEYGVALAVAVYCYWRICPVPGSPPVGPGTVTLLALNPGRFRGDLQILADNGFRVLTLPFDIAARLYSVVFVTGDDPLAQRERQRLAKKRSVFRGMLQEIQRPLYRWLGVDVVISAAVHYRQDYDWGVAGSEIGTPFVVFHRESLAASRGWKDRLFARLKDDVCPFEGDRVVVHNEIMRDLFVRSGYANPGQVSALGALRMNDFLSHDDAEAGMEKGSFEKRVTLFSFGPSVGIPGVNPPHWPENQEDYFYRFCRDCHFAMFDLAQLRPDVEVVIKPKWGGNWLDRIDEIMRDAGFVAADHPNLRVDAEVNAKALICASDVVIGFNSTTLLESAALGKHTVLPIFAEAEEDHLRDYVMFYDERSVFEIANSRHDLVDKACHLLGVTEIPADKIKKRRDLFERYVSPLNANVVLARYSKLIHEVTSGRLADA